MSFPHLSSPWVRLSTSEKQPRLRLFCFPYAGGSCSSFHCLLGNLPAEVEICRIQLPGRENRIREAPFVQLAPLVQALAQELIPYLTMPFAFFGYSMGALVCFELACQLRKQLWLTPQHVFIAAYRAPHLQKHEKPCHDLPEEDFVEMLRRLGGTAPIILNNAEARQLFLPTIRADFALCETYVYQDTPPLKCPISVYGGRKDTKFSPSDLEAWREHTDNTFTLRMFEGGHFFLQQDQASFLQTLSYDLSHLLLHFDESQAQ